MILVTELLIWILFGLVVTLDVIVYGLYRMIKERPTISKVIEVSTEKIDWHLREIRELYSKIKGLEKGDIFILSEIQKLEGKLDILSERQNRLSIEFGVSKVRSSQKKERVKEKVNHGSNRKQDTS